MPRIRRRRRRKGFRQRVLEIIHGPRRKDVQFSHDIRNLSRGNSIDSVSLFDIGGVIRFPSIAQGVAQDQRVGQEIFLRGFKLQGVIYKPTVGTAAQAPPQNENFWVMAYMQHAKIGGAATNGPDNQPNQFFTTDTNSWPSQYEVNVDRGRAMHSNYSIIYSRKTSLTALAADPTNIGSDRKRLSFWIPVNRVCEFAGTNDFPEYTNIFIYMWVESGRMNATSTEQWTFSGTMNTYFRDRSA